MGLSVDDLTKEDLIRAFATVSDGTNWRDGYGHDNETAATLNQIATACLDYCVQTNNWDVKPTSKLEQAP